MVARDWPPAWGEGAPVDGSWAARVTGKEGTIRAFLVAAALASVQPDRAKERALWRLKAEGREMHEWVVEAIRERVAYLDEVCAPPAPAAPAAVYDLTMDDVRAIVADLRAEHGDRMASTLHQLDGFHVLRFRWQHGAWFAFEAQASNPAMWREWPEDRDWPSFADDDDRSPHALEGHGASLCYFHGRQLRECGCFAMCDVLVPAREVLGGDLPPTSAPAAPPPSERTEQVVQMKRPKIEGLPNRYELLCREPTCKAHSIGDAPEAGCTTCSSTDVAVYLAGDPVPPSKAYAAVIAAHGAHRARTDRPCVICGAPFVEDSVAVGAWRGELLVAAHLDCVLEQLPENYRVTMPPSTSAVKCDGCSQPIRSGQVYARLGDSAGGGVLRVHAVRGDCVGDEPPAGVAAELPADEKPAKKRGGGRKKKAAPPPAPEPPAPEEASDEEMAPGGGFTDGVMAEEGAHA